MRLPPNPSNCFHLRWSAKVKGQGVSGQSTCPKLRQESVPSPGAHDASDRILAQIHRHGCCYDPLAMTLLWIIGTVWIGSAAIVSLALCAASRKVPPQMEDVEGAHPEVFNLYGGTDEQFPFEKAA
jgi:hypothetical protein